MANKLSYEFVKNFILEKGFYLLSDSYRGDKDKFTMKDKEGYLYYTSYGQIRYFSPSKFYFRNPYTEHNIKLWIKINMRPFELLDGQDFYADRNKLFFKCHICPKDEVP